MTQGCIVGLGLGILSWKGYETLKPMLANLNDSGFAALFQERRIFLPEMQEEGCQIARDAGFKFSGSEKNLGIYGGFRALAEAMRSETILLLENDLHLLEPLQEATRQMEQAHRVVTTGGVRFVLLRHCKEPGEQFSGIDKYRRYHAAEDANPLVKVATATRRLLRPTKAKRLIGYAPYTKDDAAKRFAEIDVEPISGFLTMDSSVRSWTNQSFVIQRDFYLNTILQQVEDTPSTRRVNGFKNIEIELNSALWRRQQWQIAIAPGLFSHRRYGDRGY